MREKKEDKRHSDGRRRVRDNSWNSLRFHSEVRELQTPSMSLNPPQWFSEWVIIFKVAVKM